MLIMIAPSDLQDSSQSRLTMGTLLVIKNWLPLKNTLRLPIASPAGTSAHSSSCRLLL